MKSAAEGSESRGAGGGLQLLLQEVRVRSERRTSTAEEGALRCRRVQQELESSRQNQRAVSSKGPWWLGRRKDRGLGLVARGEERRRCSGPGHLCPSPLGVEPPSKCRVPCRRSWWAPQCGPDRRPKCGVSLRLEGQQLMGPVGERCVTSQRRARPNKRLHQTAHFVVRLDCAAQGSTDTLAQKVPPAPLMSLQPFSSRRGTGNVHDMALEITDS